MKPFFALALCFVLVACAGQTRDERSPEDRVTERAEQRWEHLIERRFARAYDYLSPASREVQSLEFYILRTGRSVLNWKGGTVQGVKCDQPDVCEVDVLIEATAASPVPRGRSFPVSNTVTETWVMADGQWYFVLPELL